MKRHGSRLTIKYLWTGRRKKGGFKKCSVCGKALTERNRIGLCSRDYQREHTLNWRHQGIYARWRSLYNKSYTDHKGVKK